MCLKNLYAPTTTFSTGDLNFIDCLGTKEAIMFGEIDGAHVCMILNFMFKGMVVGFAIAAPVGPIGVLCIRRSLAEGRQVGLVTGLGAATADAVYGCVAAFGLTVISGFLVGHRSWLAFFGGLFLCYLGVRTFMSKPPRQGLKIRSGGLLAAYLSTLFLTLTNPTTILSFAAVFAGFGLGATPDYLAASALVAGVFLGSAFWWFVLSSGVAVFRSRVSLVWMQAVNRLWGCVLAVFGLYALSTLFFR
jgi:threonine/homoserine/homoserine lactone efflux protein